MTHGGTQTGKKKSREVGCFISSTVMKAFWQLPNTMYYWNTQVSSRYLQPRTTPRHSLISNENLIRANGATWSQPVGANFTPLPQTSLPKAKTQSMAPMLPPSTTTSKATTSRPRQQQQQVCDDLTPMHDTARSAAAAARAANQGTPHPSTFTSTAVPFVDQTPCIRPPGPFISPESSRCSSRCDGSVSEASWGMSGPCGPLQTGSLGALPGLSAARARPGKVVLSVDSIALQQQQPMTAGAQQRKAALEEFRRKKAEEKEAAAAAATKASQTNAGFKKPAPRLPSTRVKANASVLKEQSMWMPQSDFKATEAAVQERQKQQRQQQQGPELPASEFAATMATLQGPSSSSKGPKACSPLPGVSSRYPKPSSPAASKPSSPVVLKPASPKAIQQGRPSSSKRSHNSSSADVRAVPLRASLTQVEVAGTSSGTPGGRGAVAGRGTPISQSRIPMLRMAAAAGVSPQQHGQKQQQGSHTPAARSPLTTGVVQKAAALPLPDHGDLSWDAAQVPLPDLTPRLSRLFKGGEPPPSSLPRTPRAEMVSEAQRVGMDQQQGKQQEEAISRGGVVGGGPVVPRLSLGGVGAAAAQTSSGHDSAGGIAAAAATAGGHQLTPGRVGKPAAVPGAGGKQQLTPGRGAAPLSSRGRGSGGGGGGKLTPRAATPPVLRPAAVGGGAGGVFNAAAGRSLSKTELDKVPEVREQLRRHQMRALQYRFMNNNMEAAIRAKRCQVRTKHTSQGEHPISRSDNDARTRCGSNVRHMSTICCLSEVYV